MFNLQQMINPQQMMGAYCHDPLMKRAMAMCQNKDENQLRQTAKNIAKSRGISDEDLQALAARFNIQI